MFKIIVFLALALFATSAEAKFSVKQNNNMDFGDVASNVDAAGTAVINTNADSKYVTGGIYDFGGTVTRARFQITGGTPSGFVTITLPGSFTVSKSGVTLTVNNLTADVVSPVQLNASGGLTFHVAGRLMVPANQAPKSGLTGSFTVSAVDDSTSKTDDASANGVAKVVAPISISQTKSLSFGKIAPGNLAGTLTISTNGTKTIKNATEIGGDPTSQGVFSVTGNGNAAFSITLPPATSLSSGTHTMIVNNFNHDRGVSPTISGGGSRTVNVGATLNIGANQASGLYAGTYAITVNYN